MNCVDCQREDSEIHEGDPVVAEFRTWDFIDFHAKNWTGAVWHPECLHARGLSVEMVS